MDTKPLKLTLPWFEDVCAQVPQYLDPVGAMLTIERKLNEDTSSEILLGRPVDDRFGGYLDAAILLMARAGRWREVIGYLNQSLRAHRGKLFEAGLDVGIIRHLEANGVDAALALCRELGMIRMEWGIHWLRLGNRELRGRRQEHLQRMFRLRVEFLRRIRFEQGAAFDGLTGEEWAELLLSYNAPVVGEIEYALSLLCSADFKDGRRGLLAFLDDWSNGRAVGGVSWSDSHRISFLRSIMIAERVLSLGVKWLGSTAQAFLICANRSMYKSTLDPHLCLWREVSVEAAHSRAVLKAYLAIAPEKNRKEVLHSITATGQKAA